MGRRSWEQGALSFGNRWGGVRPGAGRRRKPGRGNVPHRSRGPHRKYWPVLVTLRSTCRSLRSKHVYPTVRGAIAASNQADGVRARGKRRVSVPMPATARDGEYFRVCEFSVQDDHVHLLAEASSRLALERGIRGLSIRLAKRVNQLLFLHGKFIADRYHSRALKTPRAVRNALVYALANFRKHARERKCTSRGERIDPYSSGPYFQGFVEFSGVSAGALAARFVPLALAPPSEIPVERARTWLLAHGWKQRGLISVWDEPKSHTEGGSRMTRCDDQGAKRRAKRKH